VKIHIHESNCGKIAEIQSENIIINKVQDALDIMADADYQGARSIILCEKNINPDFFDLKTKLAGEILQKFMNYQVKVAIVGEFEKYNSKSFQDFLYECNKGGHIYFQPDTEKAIAKLCAK
jgi:hypothetical protein